MRRDWTRRMAFPIVFALYALLLGGWSRTDQRNAGCVQEPNSCCWCHEGDPWLPPVCMRSILGAHCSCYEPSLGGIFCSIGGCWVE